MSGSINFLPPMPQGEKPFGLELESNPGPLAPQVTALNTRPCRLGLYWTADGFWAVDALPDKET